MGEIVVGIVVGLLTGVTSSFSVWWMLSRRMAPKLAVGQHLALADVDDYRLKFANLGRREVSIRPGIFRRGSLDVSVDA